MKNKTCGLKTHCEFACRGAGESEVVREKDGTGAGRGPGESGAKREDQDDCARERELEEEDEEERLGLRLFPSERGRWKPKEKSDQGKEGAPKGEVVADDRTWEEGKLPQGMVWSGLRCRRAKGDMVVVVGGGVTASQRGEIDDAGEEAGDQAVVSTSQTPRSSAKAEERDTLENCGALTLE